MSWDSQDTIAVCPCGVVKDAMMKKKRKKKRRRKKKKKKMMMMMTDGVTL